LPLPVSRCESRYKVPQKPKELHNNLRKHLERTASEHCQLHLHT
jgi:hypothetical protein